MNAARQVISRKVVGMGPRLTASARSASTTASHHGVSPHDKSLMRSVFTVGTLGVSGGVAYGVSLDQLHTCLKLPRLTHLLRQPDLADV